MAPNMTTVTSLEELAAATRHQTDQILVVAALGAHMRALKQRQLPDRDRLGFEIGSRGMLTILASGINHVHALLQPDQAAAKNDERILALYTITLNSDETTLLRLKQLDY